MAQSFSTPQRQPLQQFMPRTELTMQQAVRAQSGIVRPQGQMAVGGDLAQQRVLANMVQAQAGATPAGMNGVMPEGWFQSVFGAIGSLQTGDGSGRTRMGVNGYMGMEVEKPFTGAVEPTQESAGASSLAASISPMGSLSSQVAGLGLSMAVTRPNTAAPARVETASFRDSFASFSFAYLTANGVSASYAGSLVRQWTAAAGTFQRGYARRWNRQKMLGSLRSNGVSLITIPPGRHRVPVSAGVFALVALPGCGELTHLEISGGRGPLTLTGVGTLVGRQAKNFCAGMTVTPGDSIRIDTESCEVISGLIKLCIIAGVCLLESGCGKATPIKMPCSQADPKDCSKGACKAGLSCGVTGGYHAGEPERCNCQERLRGGGVVNWDNGDQYPTPSGDPWVCDLPRRDDSYYWYIDCRNVRTGEEVTFRSDFPWQPTDFNHDTWRKDADAALNADPPQNLPGFTRQ